MESRTVCIAKRLETYWGMEKEIIAAAVAQEPDNLTARRLALRLTRKLWGMDAGTPHDLESVAACITAGMEEAEYIYGIPKLVTSRYHRSVNTATTDSVDVLAAAQRGFAEALESYWVGADNDIGKLAWLHCKGRVLQEMKNRARWGTEGEELGEEEQHPTPWSETEEQVEKRAEEVALANLAAAEAMRHVQALPATQRQVIEMRYLEGMSLPAIADRLDMTKQGASIAEQRALASLRVKMQSWQ